MFPVQMLCFVNRKHKTALLWKPQGGPDVEYYLRGTKFYIFTKHFKELRGRGGIFGTF